ncbi:MAG: hypothetical protein IJP23_02170 [Oscillospiraceae bacterium]|nr:hypothetical protein [Oscillospiraceae bacterium]
MKRIFKDGALPFDTLSGAPVYVFAFFMFCGCTAGFIVSRAVTEWDAASQILHLAVSQLIGGRDGVFVSVFKYIFAITFFSLTVYGAAAVPLVVFAKGFFLSFSASVFVAAWSFGGLLTAAACFLVPEFFSICAVLLVSMPAFTVSGSLISAAFTAVPGELPAFSTERLRRFALGYAMTFAAFLWEKFLNPRIITAIVDRLGL